MDLDPRRLISTVRGEIYSLLNSVELDLAVTGLGKAGKTVFITTLIHNLLRATEPGAEPGKGLRRFKPLRSGRLRRVNLVLPKIEEQPYFQYEKYLISLSADEPKWPDRTGAMSEIRLLFRYGPLGTELLFDGSERADLTLRVVDYPGEWLLDLLLVDQNFAAWSEDTLCRAETGLRRSISESWRTFLKETDFTQPNDNEIAQTGAQLYRDFLLACRRLGLRWLQPGQFLRGLHQGDDDAVPALDQPIHWFCPLPPPEGRKWPKGSVGAVIEERYEHYRTRIVGDFIKRTFGRFRRQLVLVDVLHALASGEESFAETAKLLSAVCDRLHPNDGNVWERLVTPSRPKVVFAATKADHVLPDQYEGLRRLLRRMLKEPVGAAIDSQRMADGDASVPVEYLASIACTEVGRVELDGTATQVVVGRRLGASGKTGIRIPELPEDIPSPAWWRAHGATWRDLFAYPVFAPPRFNPASTEMIPQIGVDRVLNGLLEDLL